MPRVIEAVYEGGAFRPLEKIDFKEGERVRLMVAKEKTSRGLSELLEKYITKSCVDITRTLIEERR